MIFRQPGCLSKTRRLSAPFLRMVKYYRLSLKYFSVFYISMTLCQHFSNLQLKDQRIRERELATILSRECLYVDKKAKNLIDVLREDGISRNRSGYLDNQSEDLDVQARRLREVPEPVAETRRFRSQ
jgi:hypothetical protein